MKSGNKPVSRRKVLTTGSAIGALGLAGCLGGSTDEDEEWPSQDLETIIPYSAGGGYDWYSRTISDYLEDEIPGDASIVPENVTGAGGITGVNTLWNSEPDYTLGTYDPPTAVTQQIALPDTVDYELEEFNYIGTYAYSDTGWMHNDSIGPIDSWDDFEEAITSGAAIGTAGVGHSSHIVPTLYGELTGRWTEDDLQFVHYDGFGDVTTGILQDEIQVLPYTVASIAPFVDEEDDLEAFLISSEEPRDIWSAPTLADWDVPGGVTDDLIALSQNPRPLIAPPDASEEVLEVLEEGLNNVLSNDDFISATEDEDRPMNDETSLSEAYDEQMAMLEAYSEASDVVGELISG